VFGTLDPFDHLYGLVTRRQVSGDGSICEPPDWAADDGLPVETALRMMTTDAAYALFREDEIGSLAIVKLADLVVVSGNPLEVEPDDLPEIEVLMTMVGGETVYCATGEESLCP
jgi:predicted amidohydrolase YtcJ